MKIEIPDKQLQIQVHHIGGIGGCGPVDKLLGLKKNAFWTLYDASNESLLKTDLKDRNYKLVNKCIGNTDSTCKFNIMTDPSASSLYVPSKKSKDYVMPNGVKWGEHCQIEKTIDIQVHKLSTLIKQKEIPLIDFLSMDAQCSELDILKGADLTNVLGIACEINYVELYENQPLFFDVCSYLYKNGFQLDNLYNTQRFKIERYPDPIKGGGFIAVEEALFFKDPEILLNKWDDTKDLKYIKYLIKLATLSFGFAQPDFAIKILLDMDKRGIEFMKTGDEFFDSISDFIKSAKGVIQNERSTYKKDRTSS